MTISSTLLIFEKGGRYYKEDGLDALEKIEMLDKIGEPE